MFLPWTCIILKVGGSKTETGYPEQRQCSERNAEILRILNMFSLKIVIVSRDLVAKTYGVEVGL